MGLRSLARRADDAAFYAVSNDLYFPSTVALLNSLRLTGHEYPLIIGDCGLTERQRERLSRGCTVYRLSADGSVDPVLFKAFARHLRPHGVVVAIDSDMIVTGSLEPIIELARQGRICGFADPESARWFAEWQELFELASPPRHQTYLSSGFVAFSTDAWPGLLERWWRACERIPSRRTLSQGAPNTDPLAQGDQDALNALLMAEIPQASINLLPAKERPVLIPSPAKVIDLASLACDYDGVPTKLLHADGSRKPWERRAWWQVRRSAYVRLFRHLLFVHGAPVAAHASEVPIWLRSGVMGELALRILDRLNALTWSVLHFGPTKSLLKFTVTRLTRRAPRW